MQFSEARSWTTLSHDSNEGTTKPVLFSNLFGNDLRFWKNSRPYKRESTRKTVLKCTRKLFLNVSSNFMRSVTEIFTFFQKAQFIASKMFMWKEIVNAFIQMPTVHFIPWGEKYTYISAESGQIWFFLSKEEIIYPRKLNHNTTWRL